MRCSRSGTSNAADDNDGSCDRCKRQNRLCKIPTRRPAGRKPGSRGRYQGVEKAFRKIQHELRKAKTCPSSNGECIRDASQLLNDSEELLELINPNSNADTRSQPAQTRHDLHSNPLDGSLTLMADGYQTASPPTARSPDEVEILHEEPVTNPLGVVADACREARTSTQPSYPRTSSPLGNADPAMLSEIGEVEPDDHARRLLSRPGYVSLGLKLDRTILEKALDVLLTRELSQFQYPDYFNPSVANKDRDLGPQLDPIDLGLLSIVEAEHLFEVSVGSNLISREVLNLLIRVLAFSPGFIPSMASSTPTCTT